MPRMNKYSFLAISLLAMALLNPLAIATNQENSIMSNLPPYAVINDPQSLNRDVLRQQAAKLSFPLSAADQESARILEEKYDQEKNCAGLAAPQIGISKQIIVFGVFADEKLQKWRPDLTDTMEKTIWVNPSYEPVGDEMNTDFEGCFSVNDVGGPVARYKTIRYQAYRPDGSKVNGEANGFLARVIQHEVDHLRGKLFIDHVPEEQLFSIEEYRRKRAEKMAANAEG